jgi:hypothetical protein
MRAPREKTWRRRNVVMALNIGTQSKQNRKTILCQWGFMDDALQNKWCQRAQLHVYCIRRAQVKVGLINLCKGLFSLNARIYYSIAHTQAVCNLPGVYSTILPHKGVHCSN